MCILFFHFCDNSEPHGYRFIAASNRDELYDRPTAQARFWDKDKKIISGVDLTPGKVGGTWLGFSKDGRFSSLTNYRQAPEFVDPNARGRGHLVTNFLQGQQKPEDYQHEISKEGELYNGFNLLVGQLSSTEKPSEFAWYCNMEQQPVKVVEPGTHVLTNRLLDFPWPKAVYGKKRFSEIIKQHCDSKQDLIDELLKLLSEKQRHFPDEDDSCYIGPQDHGCPQEFIEGCRAIHVDCEGLKYGTRTNTVILVDNEGNVTYVERAMIDLTDPLNSKWELNTHEFAVESLQGKCDGKSHVDTSEVKATVSRKRFHQDCCSEIEPGKKKLISGDGRHLPEDNGVATEEGQLHEEESSCMSCSTECLDEPKKPASQQKGREEPVAKSRVVTNGTV